jgi:hypothetical protein
MNHDGHLCALSHSAENSLVSQPWGAGLKASVGGAPLEEPGPTWVACQWPALSDGAIVALGRPQKVLLIEDGPEYEARYNSGSRACV